MAPPVLFLRSVTLTFGGEPLLRGADLAVGERDRIGLVGRNGSGKSTLLKIAAGLVQADGGERFVQPGTTLRYLEQEPDLSAYPSLRAYAEAGLGPADPRHRVGALFEALGLDPDRAPAGLSGGEGRRAALVRALAPEPDILLLDEPTNHLDLPAIEWLEAELARLRGALVLISHDRRFLGRLTRRTVWIDRGRTRTLEAGFSAFEDWRDTVFEQEAQAAEKLDRRIGQEEHWLVHGVTARRKRNQNRLRRLGSLRAERAERERALSKARARAAIDIAASEAGGTLVVETEGLGKSIGGRPLVRGLTVRILKGDRVGIVGPNGAGKTTLLRLLTGALPPDEGTVRLGTGLSRGEVDQKRASLPATARLRDAITEGGGDTVPLPGGPRHVMSYLKDFLFTPEQANAPLSSLSGGERGRLMLARAFASPSNLLVLDEPTNDLDLETLDLLEDQLGDFPGTVLLVSHDRDFLDRVVTQVIAAEGNGVWRVYAGGYSDMVAERARAGGEAPPAPPAPSRKGRGAAPAPPARAKKLSFKDKHALETLPGRIAELEAEIAALGARLGAPGAFSRDRSSFEADAARLAAARAELEAAETRWLELELLREETNS